MYSNERRMVPQLRERERGMKMSLFTHSMLHTLHSLQSTDLHTQIILSSILFPYLLLPLLYSLLRHSLISSFHPHYTLRVQYSGSVHAFSFSMTVFMMCYCGADMSTKLQRKRKGLLNGEKKYKGKK